jgi:hypothetical protein
MAHDSPRQDLDSLPCESSISIILHTVGIIPIEPVEWRSGQVVFLPLSRPESTGSNLLDAMRGPSNPRTTKNKHER